MEEEIGRLNDTFLTKISVELFAGRSELFNIFVIMALWTGENVFDMQHLHCFRVLRTGIVWWCMEKFKPKVVASDKKYIINIDA